MGYFWEVDGTRRVVMSCRVTLSRGKKLFCEKERGWILRYLIFGYFLLAARFRSGGLLSGDNVTLCYVIT